MSTVSRTTDVDAARIWDVLADAHGYAEWVMGAKTIRGEEGRWPEPGAAFHHTVGVGPLQVRDNTVVEEMEPGRRLVLRARFRPIGVARIRLELHPDGDGCRVEMEEHVVRPALLAHAEPLLDPLIRLRNTESLRRLEGAARDPGARG